MELFLKHLVLRSGRYRTLGYGSHLVCVVSRALFVCRLSGETGASRQGLATRQDAMVRAEVRGRASCCWCQSCLV